MIYLWAISVYTSLLVSANYISWKSSLLQAHLMSNVEDNSTSQYGMYDPFHPTVMSEDTDKIYWLRHT